MKNYDILMSDKVLHYSRDLVLVSLWSSFAHEVIESTALTEIKKVISHLRYALNSHSHFVPHVYARLSTIIPYSSVPCLTAMIPIKKREEMESLMRELHFHVSRY